MVSREPNPLKPVVDANTPGDQNRKCVIVVMGMTGTGKSTFIKQLTNDDNLVIGEGLQSRK